MSLRYLVLTAALIIITTGCGDEDDPSPAGDEGVQAAPAPFEALPAEVQGLLGPTVENVEEARCETFQIDRHEVRAGAGAGVISPEEFCIVETADGKLQFLRLPGTDDWQQAPPKYRIVPVARPSLYLAPTPVHLRDTTFSSTSITEDSQSRPLLSATPVRVRFDRRGRSAVWDVGCHFYKVELEITSDTLAVDGPFGSSTVHGCPDDAEHKERWLVDFFTSEPQWRLTDDQLILTSGGTVMVAEPKEIPEGLSVHLLEPESESRHGSLVLSTLDAAPTGIGMRVENTGSKSLFLGLGATVEERRDGEWKRAKGFGGGLVRAIGFGLHPGEAIGPRSTPDLIDVIEIPSEAAPGRYRVTKDVSVRLGDHKSRPAQLRTFFEIRTATMAAEPIPGAVLPGEVKRGKRTLQWIDGETGLMSICSITGTMTIPDTIDTPAEAEEFCDRP